MVIIYHKTMKKYSNIVENVKLYYKLCLASLESDMAKRIMFSTIPYVAPPEEVAFTKGIVDYKALDAAVEGRKDILKYGTKSCINECYHYNPNFSSKFKKGTDLVQELNNLYEQQKYVEVLTLAYNAFMEKDNWEHMFGGNAWAKIAETLLKIARLDRSLEFIQEYKKKGHHEAKEALDAEIKVKRDIVTYMNVFDGLAHNTASVMGNLIELEHENVFMKQKDNEKNYGSFHQSDAEELLWIVKTNKLADEKTINELKEASKIYTNIYYRGKNENLLFILNELLKITNKIINESIEIDAVVKNDLQNILLGIKGEIISVEKRMRSERISRLMDAKELKSTTDVYREIKPILQQSGEINRFRDWTGKLESHPEFKQHDPNFVEAEMVLIKFKKSILEGKNQLKEGYKQLLDIINSEEKDPNVLEKHIKNIRIKIVNNIRYISHDLQKLLESDSNNLEIVNILNNNIKVAVTETIELNNKIYNEINKISYTNDKNIKENLNIIANDIAEFISLIENVSLRK